MDKKYIFSPDLQKIPSKSSTFLKKAPPKLRLNEEENINLDNTLNDPENSMSISAINNLDKLKFEYTQQIPAVSRKLFENKKGVLKEGQSQPKSQETDIQSNTFYNTGSFASYTRGPYTKQKSLVIRQSSQMPFQKLLPGYEVYEEEKKEDIQELNQNKQTIKNEHSKNQKQQLVVQINNQIFTNTINNYSQTQQLPNQQSIRTSKQKQIDTPDVKSQSLNSTLQRERNQKSSISSNQQAAGSLDSQMSIEEVGIFTQIKSLGEYPIHKMVYQKNFKLLQQCVQGIHPLFSKQEINQIDSRGNSPLILAGKLSITDQDYFTAVNILIEAGAKIKAKDSEGWSLSDIARQRQHILLYSILFYAKHEKRVNRWNRRRQRIFEQLKDIPDCYFEVKWDLSSRYIPGVSKLLPSDTFKIWKIGTNLRLDFNFVGMIGLKTKRRDMTLIFRDGKNANDFMKGADLVLINRDKEIVINQMEDFDFEERIAVINEIMNSQPAQFNLKYIKIQSDPCKSFFGFPCHDNIHSYQSRKYKLSISAKVKYEVKEKPPQELLNDENLSNIPIQDYFNRSKLLFKPCKNKQEDLNKQFKCDLWITNSFPIKRDMILTVLKILSQSGDINAIQQVQKCLSNEDLIKICSEDGFPIKLQIPLMYTIQAMITFTKFEFLTFKTLCQKQEESEKLFVIPKHFSKVSRRVGMKMLNNRKKVLLLANLSA